MTTKDMRNLINLLDHRPVVSTATPTGSPKTSEPLSFLGSIRRPLSETTSQAVIDVITDPNDEVVITNDFDDPITNDFDDTTNISDADQYELYYGWKNSDLPVEDYALAHNVSADVLHSIIAQYERDNLGEGVIGDTLGAISRIRGDIEGKWHGGKKYRAGVREISKSLSKYLASTNTKPNETGEWKKVLTDWFERSYPDIADSRFGNLDPIFKDTSIFVKQGKGIVLNDENGKKELIVALANIVSRYRDIRDNSNNPDERLRNPSKETPSDKFQSMIKRGLTTDDVEILAAAIHTNPNLRAAFGDAMARTQNTPDLKPQTNAAFIQDAVSALVNLGHSKNDATKIVSSVNTKTYDSAKDLIAAAVKASNNK